MRPLALLFVLVAAPGCKASLSADVNVNDKANAEEPPPPPSTDTLGTASNAQKTAFIGVTHALQLSEEASATAACRCMAAVVGPPASSAFQWRGTPPTVGDDALVVAIGNDKTPCDTPGTFRGPSIQGVEAEGNDIVVRLEEPRPGIPAAHGAVFPRPLGDGFLIFRVARGLPYGHALPNSGAPVCRIPLGENPGANAARASDPSPARRGPRSPVNTYLSLTPRPLSSFVERGRRRENRLVCGSLSPLSTKLERGRG